MTGKILGNRYEIVEKIGGGGMSYVYKAKCNVLNRYVAIKILREELTQDPEFVEKFKQESLSAASLAHPNIVNIYDTGIEDNIYYIVMEYVKGETLKKYIQRKGHLSEQETIRIARQVAEALKHAHSNKIVHRDIKPHNILMTDEGIAKVTDFGIARASTSSTINNTSNVIGSVHYFSPEQARGGYVDEKSDIYSLGVVMYEMITGIVPFDADNHISVAMKQIQEHPIPPSKKVGGLKISPGLEGIIMKCLEKHQSFRFQNIDEFLSKLKSLDGYVKDSIMKEEVNDSPTIVMPKIVPENQEDKRIIDLNIIDEKSDRAFKTFFNENNGENEDEEDDDDQYEEEEKEENKIKNRKITILAILSALVVALVGGIIGFRALFYVPEVPVPDLKGKAETEAQKIIEDLGLSFKVANREFSDEYDEGKVVEQSIEEGKKVKEGYLIEVIVSKGEKEIVVPNLIGRYAIEAGIILSEEGLSEGNVTEEFDDEVAAGKIINQFPLKDTPAKENDKVDYVISKGPKVVYVTMPNLLERSLESAKNIIISNGLTVGTVNEEFDEEVAEGLVIQQSIPQGQEVALGTSIWMTVSKGPEKQEEPETPIENPNEPKEGSYPLTITLPSNKDKVLVIIQRVADSGIEIIYSEEVDTKDKNLTVNVKGEGTQVFEIYIDNELYERAEITFE